jgi:uncharacterized membrane protein HdeD (DUF308 family)
MQEKKNFNWSQFVIGLLFIIVALMSFQNPGGDLVAIVAIFAFIAIFKGIFEIFFRNKAKEFTGVKFGGLVVIGIIDIVFGIFLLLNMQVGLVVLPFIFAIWFIVDSIWQLTLTNHVKSVGNGYHVFHVVINVICLIIGISLLFNPISSALTLAFLVGFYFMMTGITYLISAF